MTLQNSIANASSADSKASMATLGLLKASTNTIATTALITIIGVCTSVVTARILGPEGRGLLSAALLVATLSGNTALFGLANTFLYHKGSAGTFNYKLFFILSLIFISVVSASFTYFGLQLSGEQTLHQTLYLIICMAIASGGFSYFNTLSQLNHDLKFYNILRVTLVAGNLFLLGILILFLNPVTFRQVLITQIIVSGSLILLGILWAKNNAIWHEKIDTEKNSKSFISISWGDMIGYGVKHHGTVLLGILLMNFDKIALLKMGTMVEYGYYALAYTTSRLIGAVQEATSTALYSRFAGRNISELSEHVNNSFRLTFVPMLVLAAISAALTPWLVPFVYGKAFNSMTIPFAILLFECVISGASSTLAQRLIAGGRPGLLFAGQFISLFPLFLALPYLPKENILIYLSGLILIGSVLRLSVTLVVYSFVLKEPMPRILPSAKDIKGVLRLFGHKSNTGVKTKTVLGVSENFETYIDVNPILEHKLNQTRVDDSNHDEIMLANLSQHDFLLELIGNKSFIYVDMPVHGNIGDLLIMQGTFKFFEKNNLVPRIVAPFFAFDLNWIQPGEVVVFQGGGNFGNLYGGMQSLREKVAREKPHNRIIILPQTIHFLSAEAMAKSVTLFQQHKDVHICVRDEKSYELAKQFTKNAYLVPDMAIHLFPIKSELPQPKTTLFLSRKDFEKSNNSLDITYTTMTDWPEVVGKREKNLRLFNMSIRWFYQLGLGVIGNRIFAKLWPAYANTLIQDATQLFGRHEYIVTDRLHGHILASLMSKPHTVMDNSYGKNSGYFKVWSGRSDIVTLENIYIKNIDLKNELPKENE